MCHETFTVIQPLFFGHREVRREKLADGIRIRRQIACLAVRELAHVTSKPDGTSVLQLADGQIPQIVHGQIEVLDRVCAAAHIAQIFYRIGASIGLVFGGGVDHRDHICQVPPDILAEEFLRRDVADPDKLLVLIPGLPCKAHRRLAESNAEHAVDCLHHLVLARPQLFLVFPCLMGCPELAGIFPELCGHILAQFDRRGRSCCLRHQVFGHDAVFFHQAPEHIPLAAVSQRIVKEKTHHTPVPGLIQRLQHIFQEIVGFFQVESRKHPAAP